MDPVLSSLLALWAGLRGSHHLYWTLHWQAKGQPFYGDHELFERLYKARIGQIDHLAEVIAGHFGADKLEPMKAWKAAEQFMGTVLQGDSPLAIAMSVEAGRGCGRCLREGSVPGGHPQLRLRPWHGEPHGHLPAQAALRCGSRGSMIRAGAA